MPGQKRGESLTGEERSSAKKPRPYVQEDGILYSRALMDMAKELKSKGDIEYVGALALWKSANDGKGLTDIKRQTLDKILHQFRFCSDAEDFLKGELQKRGGLAEVGAGGSCEQWHEAQKTSEQWTWPKEGSCERWHKWQKGSEDWTSSKEGSCEPWHNWQKGSEDWSSSSAGSCEPWHNWPKGSEDWNSPREGSCEQWHNWHKGSEDWNSPREGSCEQWHNWHKGSEDWNSPREGAGYNYKNQEGDQGDQDAAKAGGQDFSQPTVSPYLTQEFNRPVARPSTAPRLSTSHTAPSPALPQLQDQPGSAVVAICISSAHTVTQAPSPVAEGDYLSDRPSPAFPMLQDQLVPPAAATERASPAPTAYGQNISWIELAERFPEAKGIGLCIWYDEDHKNLFSSAPSELMYVGNDFTLSDEPNGSVSPIHNFIRARLGNDIPHIMLITAGDVWAAGIGGQKKQRQQAAKAALAISLDLRRNASSSKLCDLAALAQQCKQARIDADFDVDAN